MTWNGRWIPIILCAGWLQLGQPPASTAAGPPPDDAVPLAVVAGKPITAAMFRAELARSRVQPLPERERQLLDIMVRNEVLYTAAKAAGYDNSPEVVAAVKQLLVDAYLRDNLEPALAKIVATDQEAEAYYQAHRAEFSTPAMLRGALIKIAVPAKASAEKKVELHARAERARGEALVLAPGVPAFGPVALAYSEDQGSRYRGGDIGWFRAGDNDGVPDKAVLDALFALKTPGEVSPVITAADGYYLVRLCEVRTAASKPFEAVRDGVRYRVTREKRHRVEREFIARLQGKIPVTVNEEALRALTPAAPGTTAEPPALPAR